MGSNTADLTALLARLETANGPDGTLDRQAALALGWTERKVTGLGLNGRTPGRWMWASPIPPYATKTTCPRMTGARTKAKTIAAIRALIDAPTTEAGEGG